MSLNQDASSASLVPGAAYVARSTWKPLSALVTGVVILLIAMAAATVTIIVMDLMGLRPDRGSGALWALAAWQMWKNHQNGAPVRVVVLDPAGSPYLSVDETAAGGPRMEFGGAG